MVERGAQGTAIVNLLRLASDERVQAVIDTRDYESHRYLMFTTVARRGEEDTLQRPMTRRARTG
jgi:DNA gyrase/topoisomerase IV subunit A